MGRGSISGVFFSIVALLALGCSAPVERPKPAAAIVASAVNKAQGSACGVDLLDLIPVGVHDQVDRAYRRALRSSGARTLLPTFVVEQRYDLMIATVSCSAVEGIAAY